MKYAAIADWATDNEYSVTSMCDQLGVARSGYYRWLTDGPCLRERTDAELTETIREVHRDLHGYPGVRRAWAELVVRGVRVPQAGLAPDAGRRAARTASAGLETHHRPRPAAQRRP